MRGSTVVKAQLSQTIYCTKKSFERQLDSSPSTAFQYYYQSKIKDLQRNSCDSYISSDILSCGQQNSAFKKFIRREWELLSLTKKRLYYAFFFHFTNINHKSLSKYELARIMEIPTPAISEYMLFRNKFKYKFDTIWFEEREARQRKKAVILRQDPIGRGHRITLTGWTASNSNDECLNLTKRFQKMCRECRHVWNQKVSDEQKAEIRKKWEDQKQEFDLKLAKELLMLESNLKRLLKMNLSTNFTSLRVERHVTPTVASSKVIPYVFHKKK